MTKSDRVLKFLNALGKTSAEVANTLRKKGIKSPSRMRARCINCPIAEAIKWKFRGIGQVYVGGSNVHNDMGPYGKSYFFVGLPSPIKKFIAEADAGRYPDLVCSVYA